MTAYLFHCDVIPLTFDLYLSLKMSFLRPLLYLELFRELNKLHYHFFLATLYDIILNEVIHKNNFDFTDLY